MGIKYIIYKKLVIKHARNALANLTTAVLNVHQAEH